MMSNGRVLLRVVLRSSLLIPWLELGDMGGNDFSLPFLQEKQVRTDTFMPSDRVNETYVLQFRKDLFRNTVFVELGLNVRYYIVDDGTVYVWLN